jgi:protein phosphatase
MTFTGPEIILNSPGNSNSTLETPLLSVRSFGMTDRGLVRDSNEDQFLIAELTKALRIQGSSLPQAKTRYADEKGHIFLVADGIGGSPAGEQASALAVKSIEEFLMNTLKWFFQLKGPDKDNVVAEFQDALRRADARIFAEVAQHPEFEGMGTTLTLAYSLDANLFVANAGDSRCYLFRDKLLVQLTNDHTMVQHMIQQGLDPHAERDRLFLHLITNAIGGRTPGVRVEVHKATLVSGDVLLLATDGLTRYVPNEQIAATLGADPDPKASCELLVAQSLEQGGRDNVTVIVVRYETLAA